jgi:hypothetical protein
MTGRYRPDTDPIRDSQLRWWRFEWERKWCEGEEAVVGEGRSFGRQRAELLRLRQGLLFTD